MTLSSYHKRIHRETCWALAIETICEALKDFIVFNEPDYLWWLYEDREAA